MKPRAVDLLTRADSESRHLAEVSERASELFRALGVDMATVLAERFGELRKLASASISDRRADRTRADMEAFLPQVIEQLQLLSATVEQLVAAGLPLVEAATKLERAVPKVN